MARRAWRPIAASAVVGLLWLAPMASTLHGSGIDGASSDNRPKRLIEFGWDEPDTAFLRKHRDQFERSPFDGCVFHIATTSAAGKLENFTWLCWGRRSFSEAELEPALADLKAISGTRFRHNFLRFNVTPADLDWFDDYAAVAGNARLAARVARDGHCPGILLDTEAYQGKLFDFRKQKGASRRSWDDYRTQARRRGREVMTAFQEGFPGLTVLVTFGHSLLWKQSGGGKKPLADCADGLLAPFLDGMFEAAAGNSRLVDGHELSYGFRDPALFVKARDVIKIKAAGLAADPARYRRQVSAGFGLWLDYDWPKYGWNTGRVESNYFTPERFASSLRAALEQSDEYVWLYTEKPRWWSERGSTIDLPTAYVDVVRRVRRAPAEN